MYLKCQSTTQPQWLFYDDSLGRSRQERGAIWGDGRTEKGQSGSDWVEITSSPTLDQFQINFPNTPEQKRHHNLVCMRPGSKAALSAHFYACCNRVEMGIEY